MSVPLITQKCELKATFEHVMHPTSTVLNLPQRILTINDHPVVKTLVVNHGTGLYYGRYPWVMGDEGLVVGHGDTRNSYALSSKRM